LAPMNEGIAFQTIEDYKYLLGHVDNKCAIAYYACLNRNHSLFFALKDTCIEESKEVDYEEKVKSKMRRGNYYPQLEALFMSMITKYDFMSVVMYPELLERREFVHDCWLIAKGSENEDLKIAISEDKYFYIFRDDLLELLKTNDDVMIT